MSRQDWPLQGDRACGPGRHGRGLSGVGPCAIERVVAVQDPRPGSGQVTRKPAASFLLQGTGGRCRLSTITSSPFTRSTIPQEISPTADHAGVYRARAARRSGENRPPRPARSLKDDPPDPGRPRGRLRAGGGACAGAACIRDIEAGEHACWRTASSRSKSPTST